MERATLGVSLTDQMSKYNRSLESKKYNTELKLGRSFIKKSNVRIMDLRPRNTTRNQRRPLTRWMDYLRRTAENWERKAQNRND